MSPSLETERLLLRRFTPADADHLYALDNDPAVMRYINGGTPTLRDVIEKAILPGFLPAAGEEPCFGFWAAMEKESGDFIGWFSLRRTDDDPGTAYLGYRLHKAAWGRGYATEGARGVVDNGFDASALARVIATTYEENLASQRVLEKLGMRHVRSFRLTPDDILSADTHHVDSTDVWDGDDLEFAMTRSAWFAHQAPATDESERDDAIRFSSRR